MGLNLNHWLRKTPQPVAVIAEDAQGRERRIEVPKNGRAWRDLTKTIDALKPSKLTCLDGSGNLIRVLELDDEEEESSSKAPKSEIEVFATLIAAAYEKGSNNQQPLVDSVLNFSDRQAQRIVSLETENQRLRNDNLKLRGENAELQLQLTSAGDGEEGSGGIMGALVNGALAAQAQGVRAVPPVRPAQPKKENAK